MSFWCATVAPSTAIRHAEALDNVVSLACQSSIFPVIYSLPTTCNFSLGAVVFMPTLPPVLINTFGTEIAELFMLDISFDIMLVAGILQVYGLPDNIILNLHIHLTGVHAGRKYNQFMKFIFVKNAVLKSSRTIPKDFRAQDIVICHPLSIK